MRTPEQLRDEILRLTREYAALAHAAHAPGVSRDRAGADGFVPGTSTVPYAGRVFTADEVAAAVAATLDFWLTLGPEGEAFETGLAQVLGVRRSILVNSGSSANLLALSALTSPKLGERRLRPGDEVITCAAGFPTTVAPILQNGLVPVFVDNDTTTLNARLDQLEAAWVPGRTKAVILAHTLGNPCDLDTLTAFCQRHDLWLIEDNCDSLGSLYYPAGDPTRTPRWTGSFGDLSTQSFYPPHHLTMGEGGAVNVVRDMHLKVLVESFRDWGRDCWCASGKDNTCRKRFGWQLGELPPGYDHKYIYSHLGYNLKPLDLQAAIGREQLRKLPDFIAARRRNWDRLRRALAPFEEFFEFQLPTHARAWTSDGWVWEAAAPSPIPGPDAAPPARGAEPGLAAGAGGGAPVAPPRCEPSWFGFMMLVRPGAPFTRTELARELERSKIGNRMLFGGNLVRQPALAHLRRERPEAFRVVGPLEGADRIMNDAVFVGVYPGLTTAMLDYVIETIARFVRAR